MAPDRIGLLGGTFDPPHAGHVAAARVCLTALGLDRVLLVVANHPWQKVPDRAITPAEDRFAMVAAAVEGEPGLVASRIEIDRGGPSFTIDTVEELRQALPPPEVFVIIGADLVGSLSTWERHDELRRRVTLVVVGRPPGPVPPEPAGWSVVHVAGDGVDVSSSEVRRLLVSGLPVDGLVPEAVAGCIRQRGLYAVGG
ncbi:MAG: nicotinate-nucleotide adenylyltransferase [Acidimicrobiales bacterium]